MTGTTIAVALIVLVLFFSDLYQIKDFDKALDHFAPLGIFIFLGWVGGILWITWNGFKDSEEKNLSTKTEQ